MSMSHRVPFGLRVANAATSYVMYLWKTLWPVNLAIFYPHPAIVKAGSTSSMIWNAAMAAMLLAAITLVALWSARRRPYLAVGWLWYLGTLVPVIGLIQVGVQAMADRYTYLPMIGVYVAVVWGAAELAARYDRLRAPLVAAAAVLLAAWTVMAAHQTATWKNSFTVFAARDRRHPRQFLRAQSSRPGLPQHRKDGESRRRIRQGRPDRARLRFGQRKLGGLLRRPRRARQGHRLLPQRQPHQSATSPVFTPIWAWLIWPRASSKKPRSSFGRPSRSIPAIPRFAAASCMALRREGKGRRGARPTARDDSHVPERHCAVERHRLAAGNQP